MTKTVWNRIEKPFLSLAAGLLMAGNFLAACSDDTTSKPQVVFEEEIEQDSTLTEQDSTQSEQDTTSQQEEGDTLSQASFELKQLVAFDYYGFEYEWTEATLLEINPDMEPSGKEFSAKTTCDTCAFVFQNLKLATPYALIKIENKKSTGTPSLVFVDLDRADTVYANMLTLFESKRILRLMKEGLPTDSAEQKAHREIQTEILGKDIGLKPANQISRNEKDDSTRLYMAALTVGNMFLYKDVDLIFEKDGKWRDDSTKMVYTDWLAQNYMYLYNQESPKPERPIGTAIYGYLYGFGECNSKNIDSVGVVANSFSKHDGFAFYCTEEYGWITDSHFADTYKWTEGYDGEIRTGEAHGMTYAYDSIQGKWISPSMVDSIPCITSNLGKVVRVVPEAMDPFPSYFRICMDLGDQLFWNTATELQYYSQGLECDSTGNTQTSLVDSTVNLVCDNGEFQYP